jgi:tetratricopeptide (TPR) repeat protein
MANYLSQYGSQHSQKALSFLEQGINILREQNNKDLLAETYGYVYFINKAIRGDNAAEPYFQEWVHFASGTTNPLVQIAINNTEFWRAIATKDYSLAMRKLQFLEERMEAIHCQHGIADVMSLSGLVAYYLKDYVLMEDKYENALRISNKIGMLFEDSMEYRRMLAVAFLYQSNLEKASSVLLDNLNLQPNDLKVNIPLSVFYLGWICLHTGRLEQSAWLLSSGEANLAINPIEGVDRIEHDHIFSLALIHQDNPAFANAWEEGKAMNINQALEYARQVVEEMREAL